MLGEKKSSGAFIPALPFFLLAPGARVRYPDEHRTSTPTYDGPSNDILLARLVTPHLPSLSFSRPLSGSFSRSPSLFRLSFGLSFHTGCPANRQ